VPESERLLFTYLEICYRVIAIPLRGTDVQRQSAERRLRAWDGILPSALRAALFSAKRRYLRCKHCGRYTRYIHPNAGFAYLCPNRCELCGRSYPMPSVEWDSLYGQAYMFYRRSVAESEFFLEFLQRFEVPRSEHNDDRYGGLPVLLWASLIDGC
jgi:hypothetical protein